MRQVFLNLILNACQAMDWRGEVRVSAAERLAGGESWLELRFKDTGPGVAGDIKDQLFDPFFTTKAKGTGLGLAIAHRFVELHGGSLELAAGDAGGAEFLIRVPLRSQTTERASEHEQRALTELAVQ
jgi:signal transduction histidine kinase